jgi:hypothetical protein
MLITEIEKEEDFDRKGSLIKRFSKNNSSPTEEEIEVVKLYLFHKDYYLRESATYALFFKWRLTDVKLIDAALKIAINENEDFDVRRWVFASFPEIYEETNDKRLLEYTYEVFKYSKDDLVRDSCLRSLLVFYGIETKDVLLKEIENNVHFNKGTIEDKIELFSSELIEIEKMVKNIGNDLLRPKHI